MSYEEINIQPLEHTNGRNRIFDLVKNAATYVGLTALTTGALAIPTFVQEHDSVDARSAAATLASCALPTLALPELTSINTSAAPYAPAERIRAASGVIRPEDLTEPTLRTLPEPGPITAQITQCLSTNTVEIDIAGRRCSGQLEFSHTTGLPLAVDTAGHCGLLASQLPRQHDPDGTPFVLLSDQPRVYYGDSPYALREVAPVTGILVPRADSLGDSVQLVLNSATKDQIDANRITPSLVVPGYSAYASGYPGSGLGQRQDFAMTYLGTIDLVSKDTPYNPSRLLTGLLAFGIKKNSNGAICDEGSSGMGVDTADRRIHGNLALYANYNPADPLAMAAAIQEKAADTRALQVNLDQYDAACFFAPPLPFAQTEEFQVRSLSFGA